MILNTRHIGIVVQDLEKCLELTSADDLARRAKSLLQLGRVCAKLKDHTQAIIG